MPLRNAIETHARQSPDALAVCISGTRLTYVELYDRVMRLHGALSNLPTQTRPDLAIPSSGRLVAFSAGNHPAAAVVLTAALAGPHAVELLDPQWPEALHRQTLAKLPPDVVFCLSSQTALLDAARHLNIPAIRVDTDEFENFLSDPAPLPWSAPSDIFLVGFTSGTTSQPKAFARARHSWRVSLDASRVAFALTEQSHTFSPGPLAHGITMYAFAETLDLGATFFGIRQFTRPAAHRAMSHARRIVAVPTLLSALVQGEIQEQIFEVTTAGSKLSPALLAKAKQHFPNARLHEYYGASELGFVSLSTHGPNSSSAPAQSVGHPFSHVSLSLRKDGQEVPQGTPGTIFVRADLAIDGYIWGGRHSGFRREGPWATVGDIGQLNADGSLSILGREGGMVITSGHNVYPQEIESALVQIPGVDSAVVLGVSHPSRGHEIIAILHSDLPIGEIRARLALSMPRYKLPRQFFKTEAWPLTSSGKIARAELSEWLQQKDARLVPLTA